MQKFGHRRRGVGLLEIMLIIMIITAVMVGVSRYYYIARENARVTRAIDMINDLVNAAYQWVGYRNDDFSTISIGTLVSAGLLPSNYGNIDNPWQGNIKISAITQGSYAQIRLSNIPKKSCNILSEMMAKYSNDPALVTTAGTADDRNVNRCIADAYGIVTFTINFPKP
jgi:hypothetical protein